MGKRGAIELQFNWVFGLVAGVLVISLVVGFAMNWVNSAARADAVETLKNIETIITAAGVVEGESKELPLPNLEMGFRCPELVFKGVSGAMLKADTLYAPPVLKGNSLLIWTRPWFVPFYTANFVYLTTPQIKYYLVYDDNSPVSDKLYRMVRDGLPEKVNVDYITSVASSRNENNPLVVFAFLGVPFSPPSGLPTKRLAAVEVGLDRSTNLSGTLKFYRHSGNGWVQDGPEQWWVKPEQLLGAIVSGNSGVYSCVHNSSLNRLEKVTAVLDIKLNYLLTAPEFQFKQSTYSIMKTAIRQLHEKAAERKLTRDMLAGSIRPISMANRELSFENVSQLY